jgi:hypothetical protein
MVRHSYKGGRTNLRTENRSELGVKYRPCVVGKYYLSTFDPRSQRDAITRGNLPGLTLALMGVSPRGFAVAGVTLRAYLPRYQYATED